MMTTIQRVAIPFDSIKQTSPDGREYWSARQLMPFLGYARWNEFRDAIHRAQISCTNSGHDVAEHFSVTTLRTSGRPAEDVDLSRFACYLTAMVGDPRKAEVASAQLYFTIQTRKAEVQHAPPELSSDPVLAQLQVMAQLRIEHLALIDEVRVISTRLDQSPVLGAQLGTIYRLGQQLGSKMESYSHAWQIFKNRYHLASYRDLPQCQYDDAVCFLQMQLAAYSEQPSKQTLGPGECPDSGETL